MRDESVMREKNRIESWCKKKKRGGISKERSKLIEEK